MKEVIPGIGKKKASKRLDELFSREVLGSVLFGAAVSKVVEKINMVTALAVIVYFSNIEVTQQLWYIAGVLAIWWGIETIFFIYLYVKWERTIQALAKKAEKQKVKTKEAVSRDKPDLQFSILGREYEFFFRDSDK